MDVLRLPTSALYCTRILRETFQSARAHTHNPSPWSRAQIRALFSSQLRILNAAPRPRPRTSPIRCKRAQRIDTTGITRAQKGPSFVTVDSSFVKTCCYLSNKKTKHCCFFLTKVSRGHALETYLNFTHPQSTTLARSFIRPNCPSETHTVKDFSAVETFATLDVLKRRGGRWQSQCEHCLLILLSSRPSLTAPSDSPS